MRFTKMHGAGNDFVVLDLRGGAPSPSPDLCRALADRHTGVGCDQILTVEDAAPGALARYGIYNADGSPSGQCGNGARCVAAWLRRDGMAASDDFVLDSPAGRHAVRMLDGGLVRIDMGVPEFDPGRIPLAGFAPADRYTLPLDGRVCEFGAVSMGNPHAVIEVESVAQAPVSTVGPALQRSAAFPSSANIGFAEVVDASHVRLRVYERGVGETQACGSGACAAAAVLMRRGRIGREVDIALPGGTLRIDWPHDTASLAMTGPATFVFEGTWLQ